MRAVCWSFLEKSNGEFPVWWGKQVWLTGRGREWARLKSNGASQKQQNLPGDTLDTLDTLDRACQEHGALFSLVYAGERTASALSPLGKNAHEQEDKDKFPPLREFGWRFSRVKAWPHNPGRSSTICSICHWAQSGSQEANRQTVLFPLARNTVSLEI